jgi:hypothetical protein
MARAGSVQLPSGFPINFAYNQFLEELGIVFTDLVSQPYINPFVVAPLAAGGNAHFFNTQTGVTTLTIPKGFVAMQIQYEWAVNQDIESWYYVDSVLYGALVIVSSGQTESRNPTVSISTAQIDPQGLSTHVIDVVVYNKGLDVLKGALDLVLLLQDVATPPLPKTKDCMCPKCHSLDTVPVTSTKITCGNCGFAYVVRHYPKNRMLLEK